MNFLIIDGNSLVNRAFFGIKLLTAADGHYTNAIFGFMNMILHLTEQTKPACIAVAFDLKAPTFRHKKYGSYKAGRKPMPAELFEQMEPLKEILRAFGCHIVTCEGFEADDILGTLSAHISESDHCYIATGDRDSLQLVRDNVSVLLTVTKMGQTVTTEYTPAKLMEEYGLTPQGMIELKALQGDHSDNIPGVPGIGPKTAGDLIRKYGTIDRIYENLDSLQATKGVIEKLRVGKESAFLSRELGTICLSAPIETDSEAYQIGPRNDTALRSELKKHELFRLIERLDLKQEDIRKNPDLPEMRTAAVYSCSADEFRSRLSRKGTLYLYISSMENSESIGYILFDETVYRVCDSLHAILKVLSYAVVDLKLDWCTIQTKEVFRLAIENDVTLSLPVFDIVLAAYLLNPNTSSYGLDVLAESYGVKSGYAPIAFNELSEEENAFVNDVLLMPNLMMRLSSQLENYNQSRLLFDMEIPLARVLAGMEFAGMAVDKNAIAQYADVLSEKINVLQTEIYREADEVFNINSPKQLGVILFEKLKLPAKKKTKTGYSTNAEVLESLADSYPIVQLILDYRTYTKLKSTYCEGLLKAVGADGRIRSTFNQTETRTGRLSSTEPNLQNIPVRTQVGREFRKFFVAREGCVLVDADYSQIELRVLAALSDDKNMIDCFNRGVDIHTVTAAKVFGIPETDVTPELRSKAKAVNFGIVYGIGSFSLSKDIHVTRAEADQFISSYLSLYAGVDAYMKQAIETAKKEGYAKTLFERRRYLPELTSSNAALRAFGERVARNMPIQGTAADIIKLAMIRVFNRLERELPQAKLIMQVHDELILETPEKYRLQAAAILKEEMEHAVSFAVQLSADVGIGKTWYEAKG